MSECAYGTFLDNTVVTEVVGTSCEKSVVKVAMSPH